MKIETTSVSKLYPNPANPRKNEQAIPHVVASIKRFGFQQPIVAKLDGEIIVGHTRFEAAIQMGLEMVPVVWWNGSDIDAVAYNIADNRTHEFSEWDQEGLVDFLRQLEKEDALEGVGYNENEIDLLIQSLQIPESAFGKEFDESIADEVQFIECPKCGEKIPK